MAKQEPVLRGSAESTPVRAMTRVALVVSPIALVLIAIAYVLYAFVR